MKKQNKVTQFVVRHRMGLLKIGGVLALLGMAWIGGRSQQTAENREEEEKARREQELADRQKELEEKRRQYEADPKNHLGDCGLIEDDFWDEGCDDYPVINTIINYAPLSKMGELGQEIVKRAHDGQSHGCIDRDDPEAADIYERLIDENTMCSMVISFFQPGTTVENKVYPPESPEAQAVNAVLSSPELQEAMKDAAEEPAEEAMDEEKEHE